MGEVGEREVQSQKEDEDGEMRKWRGQGSGEEDLDSCENSVECMLRRLYLNESATFALPLRLAGLDGASYI